MGKKRFGIMETVMHLKNSQETGACLIVIRDERGMTIPHPFSSFVLEEHAGQSVGTQRNVCKHIAAFLNHLSGNAQEYEIENFWDVSLEIVESYLNDRASDGCSRDTLSQYRNSITAFLFYLSKKELLRNIKVTDFKICTGKDNKIYVSLPVVIRMPKKAVSLRIHKIETQYIPFFIHLAIMYVPEIALGIYFMFYGGLRAGEVVNLTKASIELIGPDGKDGFLLHIKKHYFDERNVGNTKKEREQVVLAGGETIARLYQVHMKLYAGTKKDNILFFNSKGRAMDYKAFNRRFNKLKGIFIKELKETDEVGNWNYCAAMAVQYVPEEHIKEIKKREIVEPVKQSRAYGKSNSYGAIINRETQTLNRFFREWRGLTPAEREQVKGEMFRSMLDYCRVKLKSRDDRER